jgi:hypothetical protein
VGGGPARSAVVDSRLFQRLFEGDVGGDAHGAGRLRDAVRSGNRFL